MMNAAIVRAKQNQAELRAAYEADPAGSGINPEDFAYPLLDDGTPVTPDQLKNYQKNKEAVDFEDGTAERGGVRSRKDAFRSGARSGFVRSLVVSFVQGRNSAITTAYATGGYSYQQIAKHFGIHFTTVGTIVRGNKQ
jgi:hypothetical protein